MQVFSDQDITVHSFADSVIVRCPNCRLRALVQSTQAGIRFSCTHCGQAKDWDGLGGKLYGAPVDPYFRFELFLSIDVGNELLFAYNPDHLRYLKDFVAADLRQRSRLGGGMVKNRSLVSRLPRWMKSKKNRDEILKKIETLEQRIQSGN